MGSDSAEIVQRLRAAIGEAAVLTDPAALAERRHDYWAVSHLHDRLGQGAPAPACIARPTSVEGVQATVRACAESGTPLIPFGLGSGVVGGVIARPDAVLLDLGGLNRVRSIDSENLLASFDAGKNGLEAEEAVAAQGLTIGHWPQSVAVSSVGGWVATRASGQFSTAYGAIEDLAFQIEAVLPDGSLVTLGKGPRASAGPDLRQLMLGSEGTLGVITGVTLSVRRQAEARALTAFAAPNMRSGFAFQRELVQSGWRTPVMRQYDERESRRLHEAARDCTLILVHEGPRALVDAEVAATRALAEHMGLSQLPEGIVEHWLSHRNHVAGWDQIFERGMVADTVEVSAPWTRIAEVYDAAVASVGAMEGCRAASAHSSHVYRSGLNVYFTFAIQRDDASTLEAAYHEAWRRILRATVDHGGSVSHHHGIGRVRRDWMAAELGAEGVALLRKVKAALDPKGIMNPGVLVPDAWLLLALDAGTTTLRACLFTPAGELLGRAATPVRTRHPAPGRVEQDPRALWRGALLVIRRALAKAGRSAADLAAIGVTSQRTSLVLWDRRTGAAVSPIVVWSDLRGAERARELQAAGLPLSPQQAATKLEGVIADAPDGPALLKAGRLAWGNVDAWLVWKLTGGAAHLTDRSQAWPTGYLDPHTLAWNEGLIAMQGLKRLAFPALTDTWGRLALTSRRVLGAEVRVAAVIADQQSALIGHGAETAGEGKVTYGTSATLDVSTGERFTYAGPSLPPFIASAVAGEARWCVEAMVYAAGSGLDWVRRAFGLGGHAGFEQAAASVADSGGVAILPAFQGLGAPYADLERRAAITGLSAATTPAHIARAALEGLAFRVREAVLAAHAGAALPAPAELRVDGGLTSNGLLMQQADLTGLPVRRHALREATAAGAAICAARGVGLLGSEEVGGFACYDRMFAPAISQDEADARFQAWKAQVYGAEPLSMR